MPIDFKQYDSALDYIEEDAKYSKLVANISNNDDRVRLKAYELYEDMYHNRPEHIRITLRGGGDDDDEEDSIEIYMPSAKKCIEAVNRYLGVNYTVIPDPTVEKTANYAEVTTQLEKLFKRERIKSKMGQFKRYGLMKGDAILHITADTSKRAGTRISVCELKPEHYFPIENLAGDCVGCYIVDIIANPKSTPNLRVHTSNEVVRRQTYKKVLDNNGNPTGTITSELGLYEIGKWDERFLADRDINLIEVVRHEFALPEPINQIPVYHWANNRPPGSTFGMSELSGVESLVTAINQSMSDEDLTLIMQGLGVYWTDASPPMNDRGEEVEWEISPRSVVQVASGGNFGRVSGISTIQPFGDHIAALDSAMQTALGVPDLAVGTVDATIAESGISLLLKMSPLLSKNAEKELDLVDVSDQFIYDLIQGWFPAYEDINTDGVIYITQFDDPMPKNKSKDLSDVVQLWVQANAAGQILPVSWLYEQINLIMGYKLEQKDFEQALEDAKQIMEATLPPPPPAPPRGNLVASGATTAQGGRPSTNGQAK